MKPAAIAGTFSDFRIVRGRKVAQLVVEIPIEKSDEALAALGGVPQPAEERWVAVARLETNAAHKPPEAVKERRRWEELPPSQQAGIRCGEPAFQQYIMHLTGAREMNAEKAAQFVRDNCAVTSRSELNISVDGLGRNRWHNLENAFQEWKREPAFS